MLIGAVNHEYETMDYSLRVLYNGTAIYSENILLDDNQSYNKNYTFTAENGSSKLEFLLYIDGMNESYRSLHIWVKAS